MIGDLPSCEPFREVRTLCIDAASQMQ